MTCLCNKYTNIQTHNYNHFIEQAEIYVTQIRKSLIIFQPYSSNILCWIFFPRLPLGCLAGKIHTFLILEQLHFINEHSYWGNTSFNVV